MDDPTEFYATKNWTAGIIGLGYVGLPLAITATNAGLPVIGLDTDATYVDRLRAGLSPIEDVPDEERRDRRGRDRQDENDADGDREAALVAQPRPEAAEEGEAARHTETLVRRRHARPAGSP